MIKKLKALYHSRDSLDSRIFAIVLLVGTFVTAISTVFTFIENLGIGASAATFACFLLMVLILYLAYGKGYEKEGHILLCIAMDFVLLPVTFFMCGGIRSGMTLYFLSCLYMIVPVIPNRKHRIRLFVTTLIMLVVVIALSVYVVPEYVVKVTDDAWYIDVIVSLVLNALCIYFISHLTVQAYEEERKQKEALFEKVADLSVKDELTGLFNRRELFRLIGEGTKGSGDRRYLVMFDIDDFKKVNDVYGHLFGDEALKKVGLLLHEELIPENGEFAARYGGEEFIYVLLADSYDSAYGRADAIRRKIHATSYEDQPDVRISVSEGIVPFASYTDVSRMLKRVDELLYLAKKNGKNRVERD